MTPHFHYFHPYFAWRSMQGVMFLSHFVFRIPVSDGIGFICLICGAFVVLTFASATLIAGDEVVSKMLTYRSSFKIYSSLEILWKCRGN